jgi:rhodanese-related sulfurtransferase
MGKRKSVGFAFLSFVLLFVSACTSVDEKAISAIEFKTIVDAQECIIVDVRTPDEFMDGHIIGAASIDLYSEEFEHRFRFMDTNQCMALYCKGGSRSAQALHVLETELGFMNLVHLHGGVNTWEKEGYELVKN